MKFIITVLASVSLTDFFVWWASARLLRKHNALRRYRIALHCFMAFQVAAQLFIIFGRVKGLDVDLLLPMPLMVLTFIWHLILAPIALVLNIAELAREAITRSYRWFRARSEAKKAAKLVEALPSPLRAPATLPSQETHKTHQTGETEEARSAHAASPEEATLIPASAPEGDTPFLSVSRRQFLAASVVLAPPLVTIISSGIASRQIQNFRIRRITIPMPQLPKELDGMTIAHVSDTHVGRFSNGKVLQRIADATNELKADLVAVTGDIINDSLHWMPEAIEMLERINAPVYLCEGNHDLIVDAFEFRTRIKALRDRYLLVNETRTTMIKGVPVQILGLSWDGPDRNADQKFRGEFTLERNTAYIRRRSNPELFQILLAHHPHAWDYAQDIPLTLAGHTHGGQIMVNEKLGFGPMMFRYWTGLYTREASAETPQSSLVVSNGVGNWFPLRIAAPAEIVHLTLRCV